MAYRDDGDVLQLVPLGTVDAEGGTLYYRRSMDTVTLAFLIQEAAKKILDLFSDRLAPRLFVKKDSLQNLLIVHQALARLTVVIDQMALELGIGSVIEPGSTTAGYRHRQVKLIHSTDLQGLVLSAHAALAEISTSLHALEPKLAVFAPEVLIALEAFWNLDAHVVVEIENGIPVDDFPALHDAVTQAKDVVATFVRSNYSIKDVKN